MFTRGFTRPGSPAAGAAPRPRLRHARGRGLGGDTTYFNDACCRGSIATTWPTSAYQLTSVRSTPSTSSSTRSPTTGRPRLSPFYRAGGGYAPAGSDLYYRARIESHLARAAGTKRFFLTSSSPTPTSTNRCPYPYYARFTDPAYEGPNKYRRCPIQDGAGRRRRARSASDPWPYAGCVRALDETSGSWPTRCAASASTATRR